MCILGNHRFVILLHAVQICVPRMIGADYHIRFNSDYGYIYIKISHEGKETCLIYVEHSEDIHFLHVVGPREIHATSYLFLFLTSDLSISGNTV